MSKAVLKKKVVYYLNCLCGHVLELDLSNVYVTCGVCGQKWKRGEGLDNDYEAVQHTCTQCNHGVVFSPGLDEMLSETGDYQSPSLERCDVCLRFKTDEEAMAAVLEAWDGYNIKMKKEGT